MVSRKNIINKLIPCACGCGETRLQYDERGRFKTFIKGHSNRGKTFSDEQRKKASESHRGKKLSEETRRKISLANKGEKNPMFGKHHTEKVKQLEYKIKKKVSWVLDMD